VLGAEGLGIILLSIAGWMGGTLVYRNQIGVDHRYANAGKWNESYIERVRGRIEVAAADELKMDALKLLHIDGKRIALGRTEKGYVAFHDRCTHRGGPLSDGVLICGTVQCPWHGSQFDVNTGAVKAGPATEEIETYKVEEVNGKVFLIL
jgi:nitrite reductase/ring-hydroxylating ferredoxin subunit